ncbi:MAG: F0F1 ATP synthase subunit B [Candidatus Latescibacteria bacterium]|nr:F0F1 ATP synthase subunit B [Candidatus Latescibacterota bacterium]
MILDPHAGTFFWAIITFLLVLFVLSKAVWKPLLASLDEREKVIRDALEEAEKARGESQALLEEHRQQLETAHNEAREIVRQAREAAEKVNQDMVQQAREEAQHTLEQARRTIESERRAAIATLRQETADLAVKAAGALIEANFDDEHNRKLVDDLIAGIPQGTTDNN